MMNNPCHRYVGLLLRVVVCVAAVSLCSCGAHKRSIKGSEGVVVSLDKVSQKNSVEMSDHRGKLVSAARTWLGSPYSYGGHSRAGTDCSGFLMEVYKEALDIDLPRTTHDQREFCRRIDKSGLQPGDILFFSSRASEGKTAHVGMYIGNNRMIHASSSKGVIVSSLDEDYYQTHYLESGTVEMIAALDKSAKKVTEVVAEAEQEVERENASAVTKQKSDEPKPKKKRRGLRR